jgi:hypothetical protein
VSVTFTSGTTWDVVLYGLQNDAYTENNDHAFVWGWCQDATMDGVSDGTDPGCGSYLASGDRGSVVWEASSGGKTQQLQRYTVQTTSPGSTDP